MDDLVKRLRGSCYLAFDDGTNDYASAPEAADSIEELEAKLAKAVETLEYYNVAGYEGKEARTTLEELKGQHDG